MIRTVKRSKPMTMRVIRELTSQVATMNQKKIGKHRRGMLLLTNFKYDHQTRILELEWKERRLYPSVPKWIAPGGRKYHPQLYPYADHGKLLKVAHVG